MPTAPGGIKPYYQAKIETAELIINKKTRNLSRLEAQQNVLMKSMSCHSPPTSEPPSAPTCIPSTKFSPIKSTPLFRSSTMPVAVLKMPTAPGGIKSYYQAKIEAAELTINEKTLNLRCLEAQRNALNARVRLLQEELQLLHELGSYVGEGVKIIGKTKVLVKVQPEGKYIVNIDSEIDVASLTPNLRTTLRSDSYTIHKILPNKFNPLVSLMMVEKVPDSTYEMVGGLNKQIKRSKRSSSCLSSTPNSSRHSGSRSPRACCCTGRRGRVRLSSRAVAHHTDCKFIRVSGSELVQKYIGERSRMVRELFVMACKHARSIIFTDEIDSIGSSRGESRSGGGDSEVQCTMLELLNQLDGFEPSKNIKVIMATNRTDILDLALLRPERIDRKIEFPPPDPNPGFPSCASTLRS